MIFCDVLRLLKKTLGFELPLALPAFYHWRLASHSSGGTKRFRYQARALFFLVKMFNLEIKKVVLVFWHWFIVVFQSALTPKAGCSSVIGHRCSGLRSQVGFGPKHFNII